MRVRNTRNVPQETTLPDALAGEVYRDKDGIYVFIVVIEGDNHSFALGNGESHYLGHNEVLWHVRGEFVKE